MPGCVDRFMFAPRKAVYSGWSWPVLHHQFRWPLEQYHRRWASGNDTCASWVRLRFTQAENIIGSRVSRFDGDHTSA